MDENAALSVRVAVGMRAEHPKLHLAFACAATALSSLHVVVDIFAAFAVIRLDKCSEGAP